MPSCKVLRGAMIQGNGDTLAREIETDVLGQSAEQHAESHSGFPGG